MKITKEYPELENISGDWYRLNSDLVSLDDIEIVKISLEVTGSIKAGGSIEAGGSIKAGEFINAGRFIEAGGSIKAGRFIEAGEFIKAGGSIEAGGYIEAGGSITLFGHNTKHLYIIIGARYTIWIGDGWIKIGCQWKTNSDWLAWLATATEESANQLGDDGTIWAMRGMLEGIARGRV